MSPVVTTVIPTFRRPRLLRRAINSVLGQTFRDLQVCVYDNDSGDETGEVVTEIMRRDPRVRYHRHPQNIGAFENFQFGLRQVDTPYFSFLSDDDILLPEFYERALEAFRSAAQCALVCTQVIRLSAERTLVSQRPDYFPPGVYEPPEGFSRMLELGVPVWTGILYRASLREEIGYLDPDVGFASDVDFTLRAASRFPYRILDVPGAIYLLDAHSEGRRENRHFLNGFQGIENWCRSIMSNYGLPEAIARSAGVIIRRRHANNLYHAAMQWAIRGNFSDVAAAMPILKRCHSPDVGKLKAFAALMRYLPPLRALMRWREALRRSKLYAMARRSRRGAIYGESMKYEEMIDQFL